MNLKLDAMLQKIKEKCEKSIVFKGVINTSFTGRIIFEVACSQGGVGKAKILVEEINII